MKAIAHLLAAIILAACALSARAAPDSTCKVPDPSYIHAGQLGENWYIYWWCDDGGYQWTTVLPGQMTGDRVVASMAYWLIGGPVVSWLPDDDPVMVGLRAAVIAAVGWDTHRPPPPQPTWWVQRNGTQTTRPTYPIGASGKRSSTSDGRATIGAPCDCRSPIVEGKTTYCKVPPITSVSVCSQVAPDPVAPEPPESAPAAGGTTGGGGAAGGQTNGANRMPNAAPRPAAGKMAAAW